MSSPSIQTSVIICAYTDERWNLLEMAVNSVVRQADARTEIVVVIDHNDALFAKASTALQGCRVIKNNDVRGLSGARNCGIRESTGEWLVFLDDDALATDNWLTNLTAPLTDPNVLGTSGWAVPEWETQLPLWFPSEFYWVVGCSYTGLPEDIRPIRNVIGCTMCLRRSVVLEAGLFRTSMGRIGTLPVGCEETELCIRMNKLVPEGQFLQVPTAIVQHFVPESRISARYFYRRCFYEGYSKAIVTLFVGAQRGLKAEQAYTLRVLPHGFLRNCYTFLFTGEPADVARAWYIAAGLMMTSAGYVRGRWQLLRRANRIIADPVLEPEAATAHSLLS